MIGATCWLKVTGEETAALRAGIGRVGSNARISAKSEGRIPEGRTPSRSGQAEIRRPNGLRHFRNLMVGQVRMIMQRIELFTSPTYKTLTGAIRTISHEC